MAQALAVSTVKTQWCLAKDRAFFFFFFPLSFVVKLKLTAILANSSTYRQYSIAPIPWKAGQDWERLLGWMYREISPVLTCMIMNWKCSNDSGCSRNVSSRSFPHRPYQRQTRSCSELEMKNPSGRTIQDSAFPSRSYIHTVLTLQQTLQRIL